MELQERLDGCHGHVRVPCRQLVPAGQRGQTHLQSSEENIGNQAVDSLLDMQADWACNVPQAEVPLHARVHGCEPSARSSACTAPCWHVSCLH